MAKIYLVRHGESIANTKGIYQGQTYDTPLSSMGLKQAKALVKYFSRIEVKKIFSSPLTRTLATAKQVAESKKIPIFKAIEIIETNHGQWEGLKKKFIEQKWPNLYQTWLNKPAKAKFPNGETFHETNKRVIDWWNSIISSNPDSLIVTHDNVIRIIVSNILGFPLNNIWRLQLHPAAVTIIGIEQGEVKLISLDDKKHLENLKVNISNHAL